MRWLRHLYSPSTPPLPIAPTVATDAQGAMTFTGVHHLSGAAFRQIVTDWWLSGTVAAGQVQARRRDPAARRVGVPGVKVLHMIAAGDVKLR